MKTDADSVIDTSRMSPEQRAALELTESARESTTAERGLVGGLFMGQVHWETLNPFPTQRTEDRDQGDAFLERLGSFLRETVDPDGIDAQGEVPDEVIEGLARLGSFRHQDSHGVRRPRAVPDELLPGRDDAGKLLRKPHRAFVRPPIDRCASAFADVWH
jgi:hypothetical protein